MKLLGSPKKEIEWSPEGAPQREKGVEWNHGKRWNPFTSYKTLTHVHR